MLLEILDNHITLTYPQNQRVLLWLVHLLYHLFRDYVDAVHLLRWEHQLTFCTVCKDPEANTFSTSAKVKESIMFGYHKTNKQKKNSLRLQVALKSEMKKDEKSESI